MTIMVFGIVGIIILCISVIVFLIGVSISSALLKQIAFLIVIVWGIISMILQKRHDKKNKV